MHSHKIIYRTIGLNFIPIILSFFVVTFVSGCTYFEPKPLFSGISNRGIMPVSTTASHLGSNLFVSQQMQKSPELFRFIESRGAPHAIRVNERPNRLPELILYYPRQEALYIAELSASRSTYNWIVRGPHRIPRYEARALVEPAIDLSSEPVLSYFDREIRFTPRHFEKSFKTYATPVVTKPVLPNDDALKRPPMAATRQAGTAPKRAIPSKPRTAAQKHTPVKDSGGVVLKKDEFKPLNTDQLAILISKGFAERDKNGDIIHTVKSGGETIDDIAKWYTEDVKNSDAILKATGLEGVKTLTTGLRIKIPLNLIKNTKQMPEK